MRIKSALPPRIRILSVASHLFADHGLHGVTIRDIASGADVKLSALYRFFDSKESLYLAACEEVFGTVAQKYSENLKRANAPADDLYDFVRDLYSDLIIDDRLQKLLVREIIFNEGSIIEVLIDKAFLPQFARISDLCMRISPGEQTRSRTFEIYILAVGYVQMSNFVRFSKIEGIPLHDGAAMAARILGFVFPEIEWNAIQNGSDPPLSQFTGLGSLDGGAGFVDPRIA